MKRKSTCTFALGFTSFSLWAAVPTLTVSYNNVAEGDFSAKLTWEGDAANVQRRSGTGEWKTLEESATSGWTDLSPIIGKSYQYRLQVGEETGEAVSFNKVRKLAVSSDKVFTNAEKSWADTRTAESVFDGRIDNAETGFADLHIEGGPYPKVGVDFGSDTYYVALVRFYPRVQAGQSHLSAGAVVYGSHDDAAAERASKTNGDALTDATTFASGVSEWQERMVAEPKAYRSYYYQGNYEANMTEVEFYGWTQADVDEAMSDALVATVSADFAAATLTISWDSEKDPSVLIERKAGVDGEWETLNSETTGGSYVDTSAPFGLELSYRLTAGEKVSNVVTARRLRKFTIATNQIHWGGKTGEGWYKEATYAFDGDVDTWPDLWGTPKVCVDFGAPTHIVAFVRVASRHANGCGNRLNGFVLQGSLRDGETEIGDETSGTALTAAVTDVPADGTSWYDRTVEHPAAYRSYFFAISNGNAAEVELYGWTLADIGEVYVPPLTVAANSTTLGGADYSAHLTWDAVGASVTLQRAKSATGPWTDLISTEAAGDFVDESAACGVLYHYRLKVENSVSESVTYRRLKKLDTTACSFYWQGNEDAWGHHPGSDAFDGNTESFPDLDYVNPKVIVDFGSQTVTVAKVHLYPRTSYDPGRLGGAKLYGSDKTGGEEKNTDDLATALTDALSYNQGPVWYELAVPEEKIVPHRTFYLKGNANGNVGECQLYGWTEDDVKPKGVALFLL